MWSTVPKGGIVSGSNEESLYRDMFNEALSNSISEGRGIGIKDVILKDFNKINKK
jgi:Rod binding domain-containing protein